MTNIKVKEHKTVSTAHNEDYRILIRSVSEQFEHTEPLPAEETDKIELMTYGSFLKKPVPIILAIRRRRPSALQAAPPPSRSPRTAAG